MTRDERHRILRAADHADGIRFLACDAADPSLRDKIDAAATAIRDLLDAAVMGHGDHDDDDDPNTSAN